MRVTNERQENTRTHNAHMNRFVMLCFFIVSTLITCDIRLRLIMFFVVCLLMFCLKIVPYIPNIHIYFEVFGLDFIINIFSIWRFVMHSAVLNGDRIKGHHRLQTKASSAKYKIYSDNLNIINTANNREVTTSSTKFEKHNNKRKRKQLDIRLHSIS